MAEGFDEAKASLGQIQGVTTSLKKKDKVYRPSKTHKNSNGNALQVSVNAGRSKPRRRGGSSDKRKDKEKEQSSVKYNESGRSPSATSSQKRNTETLDSLKVVNSSTRITSGMKNLKNPVESDFARNAEDSVRILRQEGNSLHSRNSSADKSERHFRKVNKRDSYRHESRGDNNRMQRSDGRNQTDMNAESENNSLKNNKPSPIKPEEEELTEEFLLTLQENRIQLMKKKNPRFPKARYYCDVCDFHLVSKIDCDKHIKDNRHVRKKKLHEEDTILSSLPEPSKHQFDAITEAVEKVYKEHGISEKERKQRADIVMRLEKKLKEKIPDVMIFMYGSSLTGFGLKTADINVDLNSADKNKKLTFLLKESYLSLKDRTDTGFSNVRSNFTAKVPALLMTDDLTGLTVNVTIHCYNAHCSSELLSIYSDFDIRVRKLAVAFRYWAHLCELDRQCDGFIPPQALNLMVIYFLQVINPQLVPIIEPPKITGDEIGDYRKDSPAFEKRRTKVMEVSMKGRNNMSVGELWFRLLWFYCLEIDTANVVVCIRKNQTGLRNSKPWNSKKLAVEDPYILKKNITGMVNNSHINDYWEDSIRRALRYFGFPRDIEGKSDISVEDLLKRTQHNDTFEKEEQDSSSSKSFASHKIATPDKDGHTQRPKENQISPLQISRDEGKNGSQSESDDVKDSNSGDSDFDDVTDQQLSFDSYGKPDSESHQGSLSVSSTLKDNQSLKLANSDMSIDVGLSQISDNSNVSERKDKSDTSLGAHSNVSKFVSLAKQEKQGFKSKENITDDQKSSRSSSCLTLEEVTEASRDIMELPEKQKDIFSLLAQTGCHYEFSKEFLTNGKGPVLVCAYCEKEGHLKNVCPEDKLPDVLPLPKLTSYHVKVLSETLSKIPTLVGLSPYNLADRANFLKDLEEFIQVQFKDAQLTLFGSSCNGFGFGQSDMDICLTFSQRTKLDKPWLIESLARRLKQNKDLINVQAIPTAKVPIVKFTVKRLHLEGDISLYNILAQHNTKLLLCYSQIDPRVRILGYAIKNFAKVCDIGDASRGSLSSYAYVLMMIYYLQQVVPPVLPVLQELYKGKVKPQLMIEGCDAWFMDDLAQLDNLWPEKNKNKMSTAELWLGFLRFYVEEFNYKELVVSIRQKEPLTRFEKLWNGENIAIEDPFDLSHNLGSGLTRKMNNFIFKTFINGRMLYGSPIDDNMEMFTSYPHPYKYFFDPELLSESRPQNVRGCRNCGKMGHIVKNCPDARKDQKRLNQDQKQPQRDQKQPQQDQKQPQQQPSSPQQRQAPSVQQQKHSPSAQQERRQQSQIFQPQKQSENSQHTQQQSQPLQPQQQHESQLSHPQRQHSQPLQPKQQQQSQPLQFPQPQLQNQPPKEPYQRQPLLQQQQIQPLLQQHQMQPLLQQQQIQSFQSHQRQRLQQLMPARQQEQRDPASHQQRKQSEESMQLITQSQQKQPLQPQQELLRSSSYPEKQLRQSPQPQPIIRESQEQHRRQSPQPQPQLLRSSSHPEKQLSQSPQPQPHQGQFFQPQPIIRESQEQHTIHSPQPQQQQMQSLYPQQQWQTPRPQLLQQNHPNQQQQQHLHFPQQPTERQERDQWQNVPASNMNSNSSTSAGPRLPCNFDNQSIQAAMPSMAGNLQTQVFHNTNYLPFYQLLRHQQLQQIQSFMSNNPVASTLGCIPPSLMSIPPGFSYRLPLPTHPGSFEHPQAPQNYGSGYHQENHQSAPGAQFSGQGNGGNNARGQFMSPAVQNLFDSAQHAHMNANSDQYHRQK